MRMRNLIIGLMAAAAFGFVGIADGLAISNQQNGDEPVSVEKPEAEKPQYPCSTAHKKCLDRCGRVYSGDRIEPCKKRCDNDFVACGPTGNVPRLHD
jgi:hypothetical protein